MARLAVTEAGSGSSDQALWGRGWYFEHVAVDPKNADNVYVSNVSVSRSKDGGHTWVPLRGRFCKPVWPGVIRPTAGKPIPVGNCSVST